MSLEEGARIGIINTAKAMKELKIEIEKIVQATGLSSKEIEKL